MTPNPDRRGDRWAIVLAIAFPTLVTWVYFVALAGRPSGLQQAAYGIGKTLQFAFPLVWALTTGRLRFARPRLGSGATSLALDGIADRAKSGGWAGLTIGAAFGLAVAAVTLGLYHGWLASSDFFAGPAEAIRAKVSGVGIGSAAAFVLLGVFYSFGHSLLEEYYWRWFVFGLLRRDRLAASFGLAADLPSPGSQPRDASARLPFLLAAGLSSVGFMAHHVLVLNAYFEGWAVGALSLAVAIGGFVWAWMYERTGSLYAAWLGHLLVDAAIFAVGFDVVFGR